MTDRELLKLAAKAAGIELVKTLDGYPLWVKGHGEWNPLTDDGDALRLATKLSLTIHQWPDEVCVCNEKGTINESMSRVGDTHAATRRAIVLATAEIGKGL